MQKFWMVWRAGSSDVRVQHDTHESALMEAERLAEKARIGAFVVLEAVSVVKAEIVVSVEKTERDPIQTSALSPHLISVAGGGEEGAAEEPEHSLGYPESQARRIVGTGLWNDFLEWMKGEWMKGQIVGLTEAGETIYYVSDVSRYLILRRTGRKEHLEEWD